MDDFNDLNVFFDKKNRPFITVRSTTITFSMSAIELLDFCEYVHMFVDDKNNRIAFKCCKKDAAAISFFQKKEGKQALVRLSGKDKVNKILELANIKDCGKGIRLYGNYNERFGGIIFNLLQQD